MLKYILFSKVKKKKCTKALGTIHEITISVKEFELFMNSSGMDRWGKEKYQEKEAREGGFLNREFFMKCPEEVFEPGQMVVLTHKEQ